MEEAKLCLNCKKNISTSNFTLHTVHCHRNIEICTSCNEPVPLKEMEEHVKNVHVLIVCEKCQCEVEKWKLEEHLELFCIKREITCQYCEINCPLDTIDAHQSYCGTRTECCSKCKKYILLRDRQKHLEYGCHYPIIERDIISDQCHMRVEGSIHIHQEICEKNMNEKLVEQTVKDLSENFSKLSTSKTSQIKNFASTNNICIDNPLFNENDIPEDQKFMDERMNYEVQNFNNEQRYKQTAINQGARSKNVVSKENKIKRPVKDAPPQEPHFSTCPTCNRKFELSKLFIHKQMCNNQLIQCANCKNKIFAQNYVKHLDICLSLKNKDAEHDSNKIIQQNGLMKCQKCKEEFTVMEFSNHQQTCSTYLEACNSCSLKLPISEYAKHKLNCILKTKLDEDTNFENDESFVSTEDNSNIKTVWCPKCFGKVPLCELTIHSCDIVQKSDMKNHLETPVDLDKQKENQVVEAKNFQCESSNDSYKRKFPFHKMQTHFSDTVAVVQNLQSDDESAVASGFTPQFEQCLVCQIRVPNTEIKKHQQHCATRSSAFDSNLPLDFVSENNRRARYRNQNVYENEQKLVPKVKTESETLKTEKKSFFSNAYRNTKNMFFQNSNSRFQKDISEHGGYKKSEEPVFVPCEFCDKPIPIDDIILHQSGCKPELFSSQTPQEEEYFSASEDLSSEKKIKPNDFSDDESQTHFKHFDNFCKEQVTTKFQPNSDYNQCSWAEITSKNSDLSHGSNVVRFGETNDHQVVTQTEIISHKVKVDKKKAKKKKKKSK